MERKRKEKNCAVIGWVEGNKTKEKKTNIYYLGEGKSDPLAAGVGCRSWWMMEDRTNWVTHKCSNLGTKS